MEGNLICLKLIKKIKERKRRERKGKRRRRKKGINMAKFFAMCPISFMPI